MSKNRLRPSGRTELFAFFVIFILQYIRHMADDINKPRDYKANPLTRTADNKGDFVQPKLMSSYIKNGETYFRKANNKEIMNYDVEQLKNTRGKIGESFKDDIKEGIEKRDKERAEAAAVIDAKADALKAAAEKEYAAKEVEATKKKNIAALEKRKQTLALEKAKTAEELARFEKSKKTADERTQSLPANNKAVEEAANQKKSDEEAANQKKADEEAAKQKKAVEEAANQKKSDEEAAKQKKADEEAAKQKKADEEAAKQKTIESNPLPKSENIYEIGEKVFLHFPNNNKPLEGTVIEIKPNGKYKVEWKDGTGTTISDNNVSAVKSNKELYITKIASGGRKKRTRKIKHKRISAASSKHKRISAASRKHKRSKHKRISAASRKYKQSKYKRISAASSKHKRSKPQV